MGWISLNICWRLKKTTGREYYGTNFVKELLNKGIIDCVIHAEYKEGKIGEIHYKASLSEKQTEIDLKRSSFYFPIEYSEILLKFRKTNNKLLIIGVPCIIRGLLDLFNNHMEYKQNKIYHSFSVFTQCNWPIYRFPCGIVKNQ